MFDGSNSWFDGPNSWFYRYDSGFDRYDSWFDGCDDGSSTWRRCHPLATDVVIGSIVARRSLWKVVMIALVVGRRVLRIGGRYGDDSVLLQTVDDLRAVLRGVTVVSVKAV